MAMIIKLLLISIRWLKHSMTPAIGREKKTMKTTVGGLVDKIDAIESLIQDLRKIDIDTTNKAADYLWDYLTMIRSEQVEI
jgi:hypothetical protein